MNYFCDTHCHFDFAEFDEHRDQIWQSCQSKNIHRIIIPGIHPAQWETLSQLTETYQGTYFGIGIHPWWIEKVSEDSEKYFQTFALDHITKKHCVAIGECGLDKHINVSLERQTSVFEKHLQLAKDLSKPLIIHTRKTHNETIRLLKKYRLTRGGVIHGFTGSLETALTYWSMGFHLGIGATITYKRANKTRETARQLPADSIVLETDAPDMPLSGFQGEINSPEKLIDIAQALASIRQQPIDEIAKQTSTNAHSVFHLDNH